MAKVKTTTTIEVAHMEELRCRGVSIGQMVALGLETLRKGDHFRQRIAELEAQNARISNKLQKIAYKLHEIDQKNYGKP